LKKYRTLEQTETAQARAVRFAENVLEDSDLADELESLTPEEYADRKGIVITNQGEMKVANGNGDPRTKAELLDEIDDLQSQLDAINDILNPPSDDDDDDYDADDDDGAA
jgi:hypothetical protein